VQLLLKHFKLDLTAADAANHISAINIAFDKIIGMSGIIPDCEPKAPVGTDEAEVSAGWRSLNHPMCIDFFPSYFDPARAARAPITIIHEKAHSLAGKSDAGGYEHQPKTYPGPDTRTAVGNADSYANFMRDLAALPTDPACKAAAPAPGQPQPQPGPPEPGTPQLQRCACGGGCPSCRKEKEEELQREEGGAGSAPGFAPPVVHDVLASPGRPLPGATRGFMEARFGADFSSIRVHDDARAAESARAVDAHAYTVGNDLVFAAGRWAPGTAAGDRLLAHELVHTLQRGGVARRLQRLGLTSCPTPCAPAGVSCTPLVGPSNP
jgi:hypothetical protein